MTDMRSSLSRCFRAVFPGLSDEDVEGASLASVADWDSIAAINLLTVVEEEFGIQVPAEDIENLISFELILDYLEKNHVAA